MNDSHSGEPTSLRVGPCLSSEMVTLDPHQLSDSHCHRQSRSDRRRYRTVRARCAQRHAGLHHQEEARRRDHGCVTKGQYHERLCTRSNEVEDEKHRDATRSHHNSRAASPLDPGRQKSTVRSGHHHHHHRMPTPSTIISSITASRQTIHALNAVRPTDEGGSDDRRNADEERPFGYGDWPEARDGRVLWCQG